MTASGIARFGRILPEFYDRDAVFRTWGVRLIENLKIGAIFRKIEIN